MQSSKLLEICTIQHAAMEENLPFVGRADWLVSRMTICC